MGRPHTFRYGPVRQGDQKPPPTRHDFSKQNRRSKHDNYARDLANHDRTQKDESKATIVKQRGTDRQTIDQNVLTASPFANQTPTHDRGAADTTRS
jgi:hypothetical protein